MKRELFAVALMGAFAALVAFNEWRLDRRRREARDAAVRELLILSVRRASQLATVERAHIFRAIQILRPDIAKHWDETEGGYGPGRTTLRKFFPEIKQ